MKNLLLSVFFILPLSRTDAVEFAKSSIRIAHRTIKVELADTPERQAKGLMFREKLDQDSGMLFIFADERTLSFWMKDTLIPLSIGYFDKNRRLIEVFEMKPEVIGVLQPRLYRSTRPAQYALEMNAGWFSRNKISSGSKFEILSRP